MKQPKSVNTLLVGSVGFLCLGAVLAAQNPTQPPRRPDQDPRYRLEVEVELVNVTATILDDNGRYLEGLKAEDFQLLEDGTEQKIAFFSHDLRVPVSMGVLLDTSGSMRYKIAQGLETAREIASALAPGDEIFLITFDDEVELRQGFTTNPPQIRRSLRDIHSGGETTAFDAIGEGLKQMKLARHDKKVLLMITDGFDTKSQFDGEQIEELLKRNQVLLYAIGIDDDDTDPVTMRRTRYHIYHYMLNRLTATTGGRAFRLFSNRNYALNSLAEALLEELHQQYTLSYYPSNLTKDNSWRQVDVRLRRAASSIRHRPGYYAGGGDSPR